MYQHFDVGGKAGTCALNLPDSDYVSEFSDQVLCVCEAV